MQRTPRLRRALAAAAVLASALVATPVVARAALPEAPAGPAARVVGSEVAETLAEAGEVDVVVMLDGHRPGADVAALRRNASGAQDTTLAGFSEDELPNLHRFATIPAFVVTIRDEKVLDRLANRPGVRRIDVDAPIEPQQTAAEDGVLTADHVGASDLHDLGITGEGMTVAVLDSGIDREHPDFAGAVVHEACFAPWNDRYCPGRWFGSTFAEGPGTADDPWYHGTAASGIVAGRGNLADIGMAPGAQIVAMKVGEVCPPGGSEDPCPYMTSTVLAAGDYLVSNPQLGVDVVSMSLSAEIAFEGSDCDDANSLAMAAKGLIDSLRVVGTLSVASAGNDSFEDRVNLPGCLSTAISVGATGLTASGEAVEGYSNTGRGLDVLAPAWTRHPRPDGETGQMRGTSAAAPLVAGCAAVLLGLDAEPTLDEVTDALRQTGVPVARGAAAFPRVDCAAAAAAIDPSIGGASAPTVQPVVAGTTNRDGWFTSDVAVSWSIRSGTPVTATDGCDDVVVDTDTTGLELTCRATNGSGTGEATTTVKRDATAPVLAPTVTPNPVPADGEATADPGASDATSGLAGAGCTPPLTDTAGTFEVNCEAMDRAGNTSYATASYQVTGEGGGATCVRAPNPEHVSAGRARTFWIYAIAVGSGDNLGRNSSSITTSLRQDAPGSWSLVSAC